MDDKAREALIELIKELDDAVADLEQEPPSFDRAIIVIRGLKAALLKRHEADVAGKCEFCATFIFRGELAFNDGESVFCQASAPTYGDCRDSWTDALADDAADLSDAEQAITAIDAYVAGGGKLTDKCVRPLR